MNESPVLMFLGREFMGLWKCSVGWFSERKAWGVMEKGYATELTMTDQPIKEKK